MAIWNWKLFGVKLKQPKEIEQEESKKRSFAPPQEQDGALVIEPGSFAGYYLNFENTIQSYTDPQLITQYRKMAMFPEIDEAIENIVNEAIVVEEDKPAVEIILDDFDNEEIPEETKEKISEEFEHILNMLEFSTRGYDVFKRWYVDSRLYYHALVDEEDKKKGILELRWVDPTKMQKVRELEKQRDENGVEIITSEKEWFVYSPYGVSSHGNVDPAMLQGVKISPDAIVYVPSGLYDEENHRVVGYLQKAIKPLNQLKMVEDAVVIYRMSRAPERRVFYIDVGNLPKTQAEQYLRNIMNRYRNQVSYDIETGDIKDDRRFLSMMEDFWLPRREGGKGTEVTTLSGGQNLGEIQDVEYFQKKLFKSLSVPYSRMAKDESGAGSRFNVGKITEITRDELKFTKFINKLQRKFSELFLGLLKLQLNLKNIVSLEDWEQFKNRIYIRFNRDAYFTESKDADLVKARLEMLGTIQPYIGKYFSHDYVRRKILMMTDDDIRENKNQIAKERGNAEHDSLPES